MSNRVKSAKRGSKSNSLRKLDLSLDYDGYANVDGQPLLNNGFRPHGGYRAFKSPRLGTSTHPPSQHSFDKTSEYQRQLQEDLENLLGDGGQPRTMSPTWAIKLAKQPNHSGESQLLLNKVLTTGKPYEDQPAQLHPRSRPASSKAYYRPNSTHQYLTSTELKDATKKECKDVKLGRPTRTTLLRARQRCNSAPVNSYGRRREMMLASQQSDVKRTYSNNAANTINRLLGLREGESVHSFLIGARYNRAHCLDTRSYEKYGVYMPRNNPLGCFIKNDHKISNLGSDGMPGTPTDSPASPYSESDDLTHSNIPPPAPPSPEPPPSSPLPPTASREVWGDDNTQKTADVPIMEQLLNLDDGLNVKGQGMSRPNSSRPKSGRIHSDRTVPSPRRPNTPRVLPTVSIQGTTMGLRNKENGIADVPQHKRDTSCEDVHGAPSEVIVNIDSESGEGRNSQDVLKEEVVVKEENVVQVEIIDGDTGQSEKDILDTECEGINGDIEIEEECSGDSAKKGRVRFADEIATDITVENQAPNEVQGHNGSLDAGQGHGEGQDSGKCHEDGKEDQNSKDKVFLTEEIGENIQASELQTTTEQDPNKPETVKTDKEEEKAKITEDDSTSEQTRDASSSADTEGDSTVPITVNICRLQLNS